VDHHINQRHLIQWIVCKDLYRPIVQRLGYEKSEGESVDTTQLRARAITQAAAANDEGSVLCLRSNAALSKTLPLES
jgi:hypothetical protein